MQTAKKGDLVKVHYHGKLTDGTTFDSSEGRAPLQFEIGNGQVIPGFDAGATGLQVGEKRTVTIPAEQAYGAVLEEYIIEFPKDQFPPDLKPEAGMPLQMQNENGQAFQVVVKEVKDDVVVLDANHPLAGKDLVFDIEMVEILPPKSSLILPA